MSGRSFISILIILSGGACVDRLFIDIGKSSTFPVVVDGFISDKPGPYKILVSRAFDSESKSELKIPISVQKMILSDDAGHSETLTEQEQGTYHTSPSGIQGAPGRAYKLRIELLDGRIYETLPDTILDTSGKIERVYHTFKEGTDANGASTYSFDVFFDAVAGEKSNNRFLWRFTGTFQSETHPELRDIVYNAIPCANSKCNFYDLCSGILNVGGNILGSSARFVQVHPCECCTCWYDIFNPLPMLSDSKFEQGGVFRGIKAYNVSLNQWIFMHKIHIDISQLNLTRQTFNFWKAILDQKNSSGSLFQPVTGRIPNYFTQFSGPEAAIEGLFFAASVRNKTIFLTREDVPNPGIIPEVIQPWRASCLTLFPNGTTTKPSFWVD